MAANVITTGPFFKLEPPAWSSSDEKKIMEPYLYLSSITPKGSLKNIASRLMVAFNHWLNVPDEALAAIRAIMVDVQTGCLLIDDIEDNSQFRRGKPAAHTIFGVPSTINCGNYAYFLALQKVLQLQPLAREGINLMDVVIPEMLTLHQGQGLDLVYRDSLDVYTEETYMKIHTQSAGMWRIGIRLMMACATTNTDVDYIPLINLYGVYHHIRDDYQNVTSTEYTNYKGFAEDISDGKFSFPAVRAMNTQPDSKILINILKQRTACPEIKKQALEFMRDKTDALSYSESVVRRLEKQIRHEVAALGGNEVFSELMDIQSIDAKSE